MTKQQFVSMAKSDKMQAAAIVRAVLNERANGVSTVAQRHALTLADRLERRANYNLSKLVTVREVGRGNSRVAME